MSKLNIGAQKPSELERLIVRRIRELSSAAEVGPVDDPDRRPTELRAVLPIADGQREFDVELRSTAGRLDSARVHNTDRPTILGLPHVSRGLGKRLRSANVHYIDAAGNAWIEAPGLLVHVEGRRPVLHLDVPRGGSSREFTPSGLRVVFALLHAPALLHRGVRDIARAAGVSLGSAQGVLTDLESNRWITRGADGRMTRTAELTRTWLTGYWGVLLPKLKEERAFGPAPQWWLDRAGQGELPGASVGGEAALARATGRITPDSVIVYAEPPWTGVRRAARLRATGTDGLVVLRERFWGPELLADSALTPPLLTYADCRISDDPRVREIAEELKADDALRHLDL